MLAAFLLLFKPWRRSSIESITRPIEGIARKLERHVEMNEAARARAEEAIIAAQDASKVAQAEAALAATLANKYRSLLPSVAA